MHAGNSYVRRIKKLTSLCLLSLVIILTFKYLLSPIYEKPYNQRMFAIYFLQQTDYLRYEIGKTLLEQGVIDKKTVTIEGKSSGVFRVDFLRITDNGCIIAYNQHVNVIIILEPVIKNNSVSWLCDGYPSNSIPVSCPVTINYPKL